MNHEDDYMSDKFLKHLEDVRPGLVRSRGKRKGSSNEGPPKRQKHKFVENTALEAGLATPIPESNKGFLMLQKMGYKQGTGLGKQGSGRLAPVPIDLKNDRSGIGKKAVVEQQKTRKAQESVKSVGEFRQMKQEAFLQRRVKADLRRSQLACYQLDTTAGILKPEEEWFWPLVTSEQQDDDADEQSQDDNPKEALSENNLSVLTKYLRLKHFYCIWCGTAYEDLEDIDQSCPGDNAESHD